MGIKLTKEQLENQQRYQKYKKDRDKTKQMMEDERLLADLNKASYEKMYYYIEGVKITAEYSRLVQESIDATNQRIAEAAEKLPADQPETEQAVAVE